MISSGVTKNKMLYIGASGKPDFLEYVHFSLCIFILMVVDIAEGTFWDDTLVASKQKVKIYSPKVYFLISNLEYLRLGKNKIKILYTV